MFTPILERYPVNSNVGDGKDTKESTVPIIIIIIIITICFLNLRVFNLLQNLN